MRVALGQSSRRGGWGGGSQSYQRQKWEPTGSEPTPSPPGPTLVFISTSPNVPRNSISYKITSRPKGARSPIYHHQTFWGPHCCACGFPSVGCWPAVQSGTYWHIYRLGCFFHRICNFWVNRHQISSWHKPKESLQTRQAAQIK